jgi:hypothetical protein
MGVVSYLSQSPLLVILLVSAAFIAYERIRRQREKWQKHVDELEEQLREQRRETEKWVRLQEEYIEEKKQEIHRAGLDEEERIGTLKDNIPQIDKRIARQGVFAGVASLMADVETLKYAEAKALADDPATTDDERSNIVDELRERTRYYVQQCKKMQYKYDMLLRVYPGMKSYIDNELEQTCMMQAVAYMDATDHHDRAHDYLNDEEWGRLSAADRCQLALDRYVASRAGSEWAAGRDYVESCAYQLLKNGYEVEVCGADKRSDEAGRDIVARRKRGSAETVLVVQCRYWLNRDITKEAVMQLYATTMAYIVEHRARITDSVKVMPVMMMPSAARLTDDAQQYAIMLKCRTQEQDEAEHPRVKCVSRGREKLYYLPFDRLYDKAGRTAADKTTMAWSVAEAEAKGYRRISQA